MADEEGEGDFGLLGKASDFEPDDWKKKFELIEINPVTGKPRFGEYVRVATTIEPTCNPRTLERRCRPRTRLQQRWGRPAPLGLLSHCCLSGLRTTRAWVSTFTGQDPGQGQAAGPRGWHPRPASPG